MKPAHFVDDLKALIAIYNAYCSSKSSEYGSRNAICVSVSDNPTLTNTRFPEAIEIISAVHRACGNQVPVVPDNSSGTDIDDQIRQLLGREFPVVVVDGSRSWPDTVLGAAAGTVQTPGLLILLLPSGLTLTNDPSPYEQHLKQALARHLKLHPTNPQVWSIYPPNQTPTALDRDSGRQWENEQQNVLEAILDRCRSNVPTIDVLLARRGRGKSAVIGQIINQLQNASNTTEHQPTLTASHPTQVITCLLYTSPSPRDGLLSRMPSSA